MILLCFLLSLDLSLTAAQTYERHQILRITPENEEQMQILRDMHTQLGIEADYLRHIRSTGKPGDLIVQPDDFQKTIDYLNLHNIPNMVLDNKFEENTKRKRRETQTNRNIINLDKEAITTQYLTYTEQMRFLDDIAQNAPHVAKLEVISQSSQGRPLRIVTFGYPSNTTKPILWIDAGIHAREWISHSAALYAIWELAYDSKWTSLLQQIDIIILPNANPDGYEFTSTNRLWRKTRSRGSYARCYGVDANRNFPFYWGQQGVSHQSCSEIFCGTTAMSEPEVLGMVRTIQSKKDQIKAYLTLHSYGQDILYPWGYAVNKYPPDVAELKAVAEKMATAIKNVNGTVYTVANSAAGMYPAAGASDDWAKSIGIKYSYTVELSPNSDYFNFELPPQYIEGVSKEVFAALMTMGEHIADEFPAKQELNNDSRSYLYNAQTRIEGSS